MRILLVEDDDLVSETLINALNEYHYVVEIATDGQTGWQLVEAFTYDLILLDVVLPKLDGIQFCQRLREHGYQIPTLLLTAQNSSANKVIGLDAGADDYVVKPFELTELLARIRALLRRGPSSRMSILQWGKLQLDPSICEVVYNGHTLHITPKEYGLLELFLRHQHRVFSRGAILDHLWSSEEAPREDTVTVHIKSLRQKLKQAGAPADLIETVYGQGYRLKQADAVESTPQSLQPQETVQQQTQEKLQAVWQKYQQLNHDRLTVLEQSIATWLDDPYNLEQQQIAQFTAHKLTGSLGIFGLAEASRLSRAIEEELQPEQRLTPLKATQLRYQLADLKQMLHSVVVAEAKRHPSRDTFPLKIVPGDRAGVRPAVKKTVDPPVLLIVDDATLSQQIADAAYLDGFSVALVHALSAVQAIVQATGQVDAISAPVAHQVRRWDVILFNFSLTDAREADLDRLAAIANQTPPIPVLFLATQDTLVNRVKAARLNTHAFLEKQIHPKQVLQIVHQVRSYMQTDATNVVIVDDDPDLLDKMQTLLKPLGLNLMILDGPLQIWHLLEETVPDLLVLDIQMPEINGIELCQVLRHAPRWAELPVLFLTAYTDSRTLQQVFAAGATDCISKAAAESELVRCILKQIGQLRLLRSVTTALSG